MKLAHILKSKYTKRTFPVGQARCSFHLPHSYYLQILLARGNGASTNVEPCLRNIGRIRKYLTAESTKGAVISLVTSRFDYCNGLLCGIPEELICKLQRVQNNATRVVTLTKKHDHITPVLLKGTSLVTNLPVRKRIEFKILLLAHTSVCMEQHPSSYLREMLKEYVPTRTLRSTSKNLLCQPRTNMKTYGDRSFSACAPKLGNQLPNNIRTAGS